MSIQKAFDLTGRVALVTGGGSGIGKGCARVLAEAGANVVVVGRRMAKLEEVQREIRDAGGVCECFSADLMVEENCKAMVDFCVEKFGRLDILINSAGGRGAHGKLEEEFATENLRETMAMDFDSTFLAIKYAYPQCEKHGVGSIINIAGGASGQRAYRLQRGQGGDSQRFPHAGQASGRKTSPRQYHLSGLHRDGDDGADS